jgi:hypothetical protein
MIADGSDDGTLPARRLCALTGVAPQTRQEWADRGLLARKKRYGQLDLVEQSVLAIVLRTIPKGEVAVAWEQVRPELRSLVPTPDLVLVWDPKDRRATLVRGDVAVARSVLLGRPVYAIAIGDDLVRAREAFQAEVRAMLGRSAQRSRNDRRSPGKASIG